MFQFIFFLALVLLVLLGMAWVVLHLFGFRMVRHPDRSRRRPVPVGPLVPEPRQQAPVHDPTAIVLKALAQPPFSDQLLPEQRDALRQAFLQPKPAYVFPDIPPVLKTGALHDFEPVTQLSPATPVAAAPFANQTNVVPASGAESPQPVMAARPPVHRERASRQAMVETVRASWDPAVMMLYLGALLVVIAGLIFASYSWGTWGGWQKLGMLIGATAAFLVAGFGLQRFERIRPAARTFITIGGLLVPANALAAYTIFRDADPLLILLAGAAVTALIHGILSFQPQSYIFRYTSVAAFMLAVVSLPGALGLRAAWGSALALALVAIPPDPWGRLERFARAWMFIGAASVLPLAGIGVISNQGEKHWVVPVLFVALSMSLNRIGNRAPNVQAGLNAIADMMLVVANVTTAWILTGDQWVIATILLSITLLLVRYSRTYPLLAPEMETLATFPLAGFLGEATRELSTPDWGVTILFATLTLAMLVMARRWPKTAPITHGIAVFTLPISVVTLLDPIWDMAVFYTVLTTTLILWRWRHRVLGDVPYALASITAIVATFIWSDAFGIESSRAWTNVFAAIAVAGTLLANLIPSSQLGNWVRHLLRVEGIALFTLAFSMEAAYADVLVMATLAMGWNVWASRHAFWAMPGALFMNELVTRFVGLEDVSTYWAYLGETLPILLMAALAWKLDRRTAPRQRPAGLYVWAPVVIASIWLSQQWDVHSVAHLIGIPIGLMTLAAVHVIAMRSTRMWIFVLPTILYVINSNSLLLQPAVRGRDHLVLAGGLIVATLWMLWRATLVRSRFGFALLALAVLHLTAAYDQPAVPGILIGLVAAWLLLSLGIARARTEPGSWHLGEAALQAGFMHIVAVIGPHFGTADIAIDRPAIVLTLVSLAGTIAVYGMLVRSRWHLFAASAVAMAALMLQINAGQPGNVHVYTVPLAVYLLGIGLLLRNYPQTANVLLAAGSGVLVIPAMLEALTTGSLNWLWIALAESLALFLLGTVLQLRIPTGAAVIAVSVIALRMLVMAINAYASWISMLAIGVVLLLLGTLWLMYRDAIQERLHVIFSRWLAFH